MGSIPSGGTKISKSFSNLLDSVTIKYNDIFTFGKYMDCTVEDVINYDPDYILWLYKEGRLFEHKVIRACVVLLTEELQKLRKTNRSNYSYNRTEQANINLNQQDDWLDDDIPF